MQSRDRKEENDSHNFDTYFTGKLLLSQGKYLVCPNVQDIIHQPKYKSKLLPACPFEISNTEHKLRVLVQKSRSYLYFYCITVCKIYPKEKGERGCISTTLTPLLTHIGMAPVSFVM